MMYHILFTLVLVSMMLSGGWGEAVRSASNFVGVRGRTVALQLQDFDEGQETKRVPAGFMGLRGKKDLWRRSVTAAAAEALYKRALQGFMGLRGKKEPEVVNQYDYDTKRAPSGFIGMRGKKMTFFPSFRSSKFEYSDKRAPMNFLGMRGKKGDGAMDVKRVPSGFYGLRG